MRTKFLDIFGSLDLFKRPISLFIGQRKYNSTIMGFLLSLAIYGFLLHSFLVSDMFNKKNPLIYDQGIISQNRPEFNFNFSIPLYVSDSSAEKYYDPSIFKVKAINYDMVTDPVTNNGKITLSAESKELKLCEPSDFQDPNDYYKQGFKNYLCMKKKNLTIGGYWDESNVKYLYTYVERCNNLTSNVVCKSDEEIDAFFSRKFYGIHMPNTFFDMNDYSLPLRNVWRTEYQLIDVNMLKRLKVFVKKVEFIDDKGYLFEDKAEIDSFSYDYTEIDFKNQNRSAIMFEIFLYSSSVIQKKVRKYQKISEVLAALGGQASFLMIIGFLMTSLHNSLDITSKVINELYRFQKERPKSGGKNERRTNEISYSNQQDSTYRSQNFNININNSFTPAPINRQNYIESGNDGQPNNNSNNEPNPSQVSYKGYINKKIVEIEPCELEAMSLEMQQHPLGAEESKAIFPNIRAKNEKMLLNLENEVEGSSNIKFGVKDLLKMKFFALVRRRPRFKEKLFSQAQDRFLNEIDIINILRRLQELEKLKVILLSPEQLDLFTLLQKPMIFVEDNEDETFLKSMENTKETLTFNQRMSVVMGGLNSPERDLGRFELKKSRERALRHYRSLRANVKRSEIDNRFLAFIEERLKEAENSL